LDLPVSVLVVDDRPANRVALKAVLGGAAYRIVEAGSGSEALLRLLEEDFALIVIDVVMPHMGGLELANAIRARARTAAVPIVFMTAVAADTELIRRGYQAGAVDYLIKPLVPEMVRAKVAVFAELYRQRKQIEAQAQLLLDSERHKSELRIVELQLASERRYRGLAEALPNIIWTARPDGTVDYFNHRWYEYAGISVEDAQGSWQGALHPNDAAACLGAWRDAIRTGDMREVECRLKRASDGASRWHLCRAVAVRGSAGQILSWLGTFTDIDDQKRAQSVLAEFKGTLDAVLDAVYIFDPDDWHLLYANQGAALLLGYGEAELLRRQPLDFMAEHDAAGLRELLAPLRDGSKPVITLETRFRRRDARLVPVEVSLQLIRIDGSRVVSIARDITDRRRIQLERELLYREAMDAIRARDEFLAVASHELRTPLSTLQLQIESLLRPSRKDRGAALTSEQLRPKLELAVRQIGRLARLISELMDISKISAGRLRLELEEVDLAAVVTEAAQRLDDEAARSGTPLEVRAEAPVVGRWDRVRVEQVVTNLVTNALKFGAGQPVAISVEGDGPIARLTISDRGIGIAPEDIERIFQRYEQAISARAYGGLGLGLYIVRQIVEAHGGTIRVQSERGVGSTFTVELPRAVPALRDRRAELSGAAEEAEPAPHPDGGRATGLASPRASASRLLGELRRPARRLGGVAQDRLGEAAERLLDPLAALGARLVEGPAGLGERGPLARLDAP
jgi:PAS domain S-box-containing protein